MKLPQLNKGQRWLLAGAGLLILFIELDYLTRGNDLSGIGWVVAIVVAAAFLLVAANGPHAVSEGGVAPTAVTPAAPGAVHKNVGVITVASDTIDRDVFASFRAMPPEILKAVGDPSDLARSMIDLYALGLFLIVKSKVSLAYASSEEYLLTKSAVISVAAARDARLFSQTREEAMRRLVAESLTVEKHCFAFVREVSSGNTSAPGKALVDWLRESTAAESAGGLNLHQYTLKTVRSLQLLLAQQG